MKNLFKQILVLVMATASLFVTSTAFSQGRRDVSKYNLFVPGENLNGYDPVSYFPEGGGSPAMGLMVNRLDYMGVTYFFSTVQNKDLFLANPKKYEPTYGQWCAFAMASGTYIKINPMHYTISGNRLHFFVSKRAKTNFDEDIAAFEANADMHWKILSGEDPRI